MNTLNKIFRSGFAWRPAMIRAAAFVATLGPTGLASATTTILRVRADAEPGGDGASWGTAYNHLEDALAFAESNPGAEEVWVAAGIYHPPNLGFEIPLQTSVYGGFNGTESLRTQRNPSINETILTGDPSGNDRPVPIPSPDGTAFYVPPEYEENAPRIVEMYGSLDGFTVAGCNNPGGSAIVCFTGAALSNCLLRDNVGGACVMYGGGTISGCTFLRNTGSEGAGLAIVPTLFGGTPPAIVDSCRFFQNLAEHAPSISTHVSATTINNCVMMGNISLGPGAGVYVYVVTSDGSPVPVVVSNCTIAFNTINIIAPAGAVGAGIEIASAPSDVPVQVKSTIVKYNFPPNQPLGPQPSGNYDVYRESQVNSSVTLTSCICTSGASGFPSITRVNCSNVDPRLECPGGPDGLIGTSDDIFRLMPGSSCIDFAPSSLTSSTTDAYARPRVFNDPSVVGANTLDCGAAEEQGFAGSYIVPPDGIPGYTSVSSGTYSRLFDSQVSATLFSSAPGGAILTLTSTTTPAMVACTPVGSIDQSLTLDHVGISTAGEIILGDRTLESRCALSTTGSPGITARSIRLNNGSMALKQSLPCSLSDGLYIGAKGIVTVNSSTSMDGSISNSGLLAQFGPSPTALHLSGSFTQAQSPLSGDPAPSIQLSAGPDGSGQVNCDGALTLAGSLSLSGAEFPEIGPPIGTAWTLFTGSSRTGTFDTAFLPGWADRITRLVYASTEARSATVTAQVESTNNVVGLSPPLGFPVPGTPSAAAAGLLHAAPDPGPDLVVVVPDPMNPTTDPGTLYVLFNLGVTANVWNGYAAITVVKTTGINPSYVRIADFNGDGLNDIAVSNRGSDSIRIYFNDGADDFPISTDITTDSGPAAIGAADVDSDGDTDLVAATAAGRLDVLFNDGTGAFFAGESIPIGTSPSALCIANLDSANGPDIAVTDSVANVIQVVENAGPGLLRSISGFHLPRIFSSGLEPIDIQPGNIDNSKNSALVAVNRADGTVTILRRDAEGNYLVSSGAIGNLPSSVAAIDLDADGLDDIAAIAMPTGATEATVRVLRTSVGDAGNVELTSAPDIAPQSTPTLVLTADLDADGRADLITVGPQAAARGSNHVRDVGSNIAALLNPAPCPGDVNGDHAVNTIDLGGLLSHFGQGVAPGTLGDLNGDGTVNTLDLGSLLSHFGQPCP